MEKVNANVPAAFFIDGPGGTGKSFLYKALLATVRSRGDIALAIATSGAAASLLPGGRTAHSRFKIPLQQEINSTCNISKQSAIGQLVQVARLIIWDEAAMAKKYAIESLDRLLRDLLNSDCIFGGKVLVFGGDFQQTLPVVRKGQREYYVSASLVNSYLWPHLQKIRLTENMRARSDPSFSDFLLKIGNGTEPTILDNKIKLQSSMLIPFIDDKTSLDLLINTVYPSLPDFLNNSSVVTNRAILSTTNDTVHDVNQILIERFPGQETKYISFDQTLDSTKQANHGDFLNSIQPPGLPPHELILKPMCPVILLRNLNPTQGLYNGTCLICLNFDKNVIHAEISVGIHAGKHVFIPRIPLHSSNDESYPIPFKRIQFPISLCFAMTINKSQGQTLDFVGIYLKEPVFSHGQLYVALSRAKTSTNVKILLRPVTVHSTETSYTRNIVYHEILAAAADI
ncbi:ATP-dependent DNA helicase PIF1-like [Coffea eugenioides]|uniref:ATP-dependent DNA helicase PIF1-like n=1 Tax=Coffea eugenioides TaxID=49369 RepID=UPI000F60C07A|nr:ATP-dependent DNA helicase PIF1-like [Coffea eugenioides]